MIKLRPLRWRDGPGLFRWTRCKHEDPSKREVVALESERKDERMNPVLGMLTAGGRG